MDTEWKVFWTDVWAWTGLAFLGLAGFERLAGALASRWWSHALVALVLLLLSAFFYGVAQIRHPGYAMRCLDAAAAGLSGRRRALIFIGLLALSLYTALAFGVDAYRQQNAARTDFTNGLYTMNIAYTLARRHLHSQAAALYNQGVGEWTNANNWSAANTATLEQDVIEALGAYVYGRPTRWDVRVLEDFERVITPLTRHGIPNRFRIQKAINAFDADAPR